MVECAKAFEQVETTPYSPPPPHPARVLHFRQGGVRDTSVTKQRVICSNSKPHTMELGLCYCGACACQVNNEQWFLEAQS